MNVFNKVAIKSLKHNRTRTIVTIIGVVLSVAMFTAVTTFIVSFQNYLVEHEIERMGSWHVEFEDVDYDFVEKQNQDTDLETIAVTQDVGYALLEESENASKPYLFVMQVDDAGFDTLPINLIEGRLAQNSSEVVISEHIETNGGVSYKIGDILTLPVGTREIDGQILGQYNQYYTDEEDESSDEVFTPREIKTYTVVGICKRLGTENYSAPGYTIITKMDSQLDKTGKYTTYCTLKNPKNVYEYAENNTQGNSYYFNSGLLRYTGVSDNDSFNSVLYSLAGILMALIMIGSVLLIYNSFAISVSERSRQFGVLSSIGATKKQLRKSVLFEGFFIGAIGIPIGVILGLGGSVITLKIVEDLLGNISSNEISLNILISASAILVAVIVGIVTIVISAYIPAKRAVKKPPIEIIRQSDDIKIKAKSVKTSKIVGKIFGMEGTLALKNFKRNKKRYRSTVLSLFISIVLFVSASAFGMYLKMGTEMTIEDYGFDISFSPTQQSYEKDEQAMLKLYDNLKSTTAVTDGAYVTGLNFSADVNSDEISDEYKTYQNELNSMSDTPEEQGDLISTGITVKFVDDDTYQEYIKKLKLPLDEYTVEKGKLVAVAKMIGYNSQRKRTVSIDMFKNDSVSLEIVPTQDEQSDFSKNITFTIVDEMPQLLSQTTYGGAIAFAPYSSRSFFGVPEGYFSEIIMNFTSDDPMKSADEMEAIIKEFDVGTGYSLFNVSEMIEANRNVLTIINMFTYGFVILISLITIANVFNTISTSIRLRRREFAMLRSIGMGNRSFNKMMNFECIFYGIKALLYGVPVSLAITWLIYHAVLNGVDVAFVLPWSSVAISVLSVFVVVFITMIYSTSKIKKENVIDALRVEV